MHNVELGLRRKTEREFQRVPGIFREIHRHQYPTIRTLSRPLDDQHRTVSFARNLFCGGSEKQIFQEMFAVRAHDHKFRPFLSGSADDLYERLTGHDSNVRGGLLRQRKGADLLMQPLLCTRYKF